MPVNRATVVGARALGLSSNAFTAFSPSSMAETPNRLTQASSMGGIPLRAVRLRFVVLSLLSIMAGLVAIASEAPSAEAQTPPGTKTEQIVVLKDEADLDNAIRRHRQQLGVQVTSTYQYAFKGYIALVEDQRLSALALDSAVLFIDNYFPRRKVPHRPLRVKPRPLVRAVVVI